MTERTKEHARKYGIGLAPIERAVTEARGSLRAEATLRAPWGRIYSLYAARSPAWDAPYFVVVLTEKWGDEEVAISVHVVPETILAVGLRGHPPEMLRRLAHHERFGLTISVGGHQGRFAVSQTIPGAGDGQGVRLQDTPPPGHEVVLEEMVRCEAEEVQVLLVFAVDATAVKEHLGLG